MHRRNHTFGISLLISFAWSFSVHAAELRSEHTYKLSEGESAPAATIEDASWLVGSWTGEAFGQRFEEVWNPPSVGTMIGMFKLMDDEAVNFYELVMLSVEDGTLSLKVKHFHADFTSWEEKEKFVNFKLVKKEENALHFNGLSFYRRDKDHIDAYIVLREGEEVSEHLMQYQRTQ
jgi:hypothetical protein